MLNPDVKWMKLAIKEAKLAKKFHEVPVGAVIVNTKNNSLIAKSGNKVVRTFNPIKHAEIEVINSALKKIKSNRLINTSIYITLEPCLMCAAAISEVQIQKVFFGAYDLKKGAIENGQRIYSKNNYFKPEYYGGFLEKECSILMKNFFKKLR